MTLTGQTLLRTARSAAVLDSLAVLYSARAAPPIAGVPAVVGCYTNSVSTARTTTGTSRIPYIVGVTGTNIRLVFDNWLVDASVFFDVDNAAAITIKASVEIGATIIPVTFGGKLSATIDGGGFAVTDPVAAEVTAGQTLYVRVFIQPTSNWYHNRFAYLSSGMGGWTVTTDLTPAGSAAIADSGNVPLFGPGLITVEPTTSLRAAVQVFGDSIGHGVNDGAGSQWQGPNVATSRLGIGGFVARACSGVAGLIQSAIPGDNAAGFRTAVGHMRRAVFTTASPVMICQYGRNDITGGATLATLQGNLLWLWQFGAGRGQRVWQTTITPKSSSTNGYLDLVNQTVIAGVGESVRVAFNAWLRAGAPIVSGAAVAVGTSGAITAGQQGHPLVGYLEIADQVESARDSGLWKAAVNQRTVSNGVTTANGSIVTSATAAFTSADLGRAIVIPGAGTSGGLYQGIITVINSGTSVSVTGQTATAIASGATVTIADTFTRDGLHPDSWGYIQAATAIVPASL
jgi:hypothetical protein